MGHGGAREGGGRPKGSPNKATLAKKDMLDEALQAANQHLTPEAIDQLAQSPANLMRFVSAQAAKAGLWRDAASIAKDAAPYFDKRLAPAESAEGDENR